jgi:hypothetical protein
MHSVASSAAKVPAPQAVQSVASAVAEKVPAAHGSHHPPLFFAPGGHGPVQHIFAASRRAAVPGPHGDRRNWSAQVHGAGSRKTAFVMAHAPVCVLFWPQASPRAPQAASSSWP